MPRGTDTGEEYHHHDDDLMMMMMMMWEGVTIKLFIPRSKLNTLSRVGLTEEHALSVLCY